MTATTARSALKATGLRKSFGEKTVLDGIDFDIAGGTTFSLLGPNGAGKTTTVQILSTLLSPDAGEVRVAGFDPAREPDAVRAAIGLTGQFSAVDNLLVAEGTPDELKRRIPGGHARLSFHDLDGLNVAAEVLGEVSRDNDTLVLQVPTDGTPKSLAALLDRLDRHAVPVERVTVQTADLD